MVADQMKIGWNGMEWNGWETITFFPKMDSFLHFAIFDGK
jgi:hypothetical protein